MTSSTRSAPPQRGFRRPARPPLTPQPRRRPAEPPRARASFDRVLRWGLAVSIVAHLAVLVFYPSFIRMEVSTGPVAGAELGAAGGSGLEMIVPIPVEGGDEPEQPLPEEAPTAVTPPPAAQPRVPSSRPAPAQPGPEGRPGAAERGDVGTPRAGGSGADALRPGYSDSRLWVDPSDPAAKPQKTQHQEYMEHLQARIDAVNDSTGGGPRTDWTHTDEKGRRWGLSPDGLHLGGITIPPSLLPIPGATGTNQDIERERERQRQRDEIRQQEERRERDRVREERNRTTGERQQTRRGGGGGGGG